jgi:hypothetical protein
MDQMFQPTQKSSEQLPAPTGPGETLPQIAVPEQRPPQERGEKQHVGAAGAAVQQAYTDDATLIAQQPLIPQVDDATTAQQAATAASATANVDVIEKEWVEKAKSIVAKTKDDPREQAEELTGMKREYIEKRFGKSLPDNRAA